MSLGIIGTLAWFLATKIFLGYTRFGTDHPFRRQVVELSGCSSGQP